LVLSGPRSNTRFEREKPANRGFLVDNLWGQLVDKKSDFAMIFLLRMCGSMSDECAREVRGTSGCEQHRL
jgi:hypothetical protein